MEAAGGTAQECVALGRAIDRGFLAAPASPPTPTPTPASARTSSALCAAWHELARDETKASQFVVCLVAKLLSLHRRDRDTLTLEACVQHTLHVLLQPAAATSSATRGQGSGGAEEVAPAAFSPAQLRTDGYYRFAVDTLLHTIHFVIAFLPLDRTYIPLRTAFLKWNIHRAAPTPNGASVAGGPPTGPADAQFRSHAPEFESRVMHMLSPRYVSDPQASAVLVVTAPAHHDAQWQHLFLHKVCQLRRSEDETVGLIRHVTEYLLDSAGDLSEGVLLRTLLLLRAAVVECLSVPPRALAAAYEAVLPLYSGPGVVGDKARELLQILDREIRVPGSTHRAVRWADGAVHALVCMAHGRDYVTSSAAGPAKASGSKASTAAGAAAPSMLAEQLHHALQHGSGKRDVARLATRFLVHAFKSFFGSKFDEAGFSATLADCDDQLIIQSYETVKAIGEYCMTCSEEESNALCAAKYRAIYAILTESKANHSVEYVAGKGCWDTSRRFVCHRLEALPTDLTACVRETLSTLVAILQASIAELGPSPTPTAGPTPEERNAGKAKPCPNSPARSPEPAASRPPPRRIPVVLVGSDELLRYVATAWCVLHSTRPELMLQGVQLDFYYLCLSRPGPSGLRLGASQMPASPTTAAATAAAAMSSPLHLAAHGLDDSDSDEEDEFRLRSLSVTGEQRRVHRDSVARSFSLDAVAARELAPSAASAASASSAGDDPRLGASLSPTALSAMTWVRQASQPDVAGQAAPSSPSVPASDTATAGSRSSTASGAFRLAMDDYASRELLTLAKTPPETFRFLDAVCEQDRWYALHVRASLQTCCLALCAPTVLVQGGGGGPPRRPTAEGGRPAPGTAEDLFETNDKALHWNPGHVLRDLVLRYLADATSTIHYPVFQICIEQHSRAKAAAGGPRGGARPSNPSATADDPSAPAAAHALVFATARMEPQGLSEAAEFKAEVWLSALDGGQHKYRLDARSYRSISISTLPDLHSAVADASEAGVHLTFRLKDGTGGAFKAQACRFVCTAPGGCRATVDGHVFHNVCRFQALPHHHLRREADELYSDAPLSLPIRCFVSPNATPPT